MKKNIIATLSGIWLGAMIATGCATTSTTTAVSHTELVDSTADPVPTAVDVSVYAPPPVPALHPATSITASVPGASQVVVRRGVRLLPPFDGVCLNSQAVAAVEAGLADEQNTCRLESRTALANLGAMCLRDLRTVQSDTETLRNVYRARLHDDEAQIQADDRLVQQMQRSSGSSVWANLGWGSLGVVAGAVIGALIVTFAR